MSQKYIVSTAFGTYFSESVIVHYLAWESGYLGTPCEIPTILGWVSHLQNKSDRGQNWQGDTKSIVECNDLLSLKVWAGDDSIARIKVEKYFFFMLACFYCAKFQSHDFKNHIIAFFTPKNIRWPNFMKIEQIVFSNDLP